MTTTTLPHAASLTRRLVQALADRYGRGAIPYAEVYWLAIDLGARPNVATCMAGNLRRAGYLKRVRRGVYKLVRR